MSETERDLMGQHAVYLRGLTAAGKCIVAGPVLDRAAPWGLGILDVETEDEARQLLLADPTVIAGLNTFELLPMHVGMERGRTMPS
jgi:uncharacterized protein YciI